MFLDHVPDVCGHRDAITADARGGRVQCNVCWWGMDAYTFIVEPREDPFVSSMLAEQYARWTGDVHVPCVLPLVDLPGILPVHVITSYKALAHGLELLKAANAPFVAAGGSPTINRQRYSEILLNFLKEFIASVVALTDSADLLVSVLVHQMEKLLNKDMLDQFIDVAVPYVLACGVTTTFETEGDDASTPLAYRFHLESRLATRVRAHYSRFSIPFELLYVLVYCYVCGRNGEIITNLAIDCFVRICRGEFYSTTTNFSQRVESILAANVSYRKNTDLHYAVRQIREGHGRDCLSTLTFIRTYARLERLLLDKFHGRGEDAAFSDYAFSQAFPRVLFGDRHGEYMGFSMALRHIVTELQRQQKSAGVGDAMPAGTVTVAKKLYDLCVDTVRRIVAFENGKVRPCWTRDTFDLFLAHDQTFKAEMQTVLEMLLPKEPERRILTAKRRFVPPSEKENTEKQKSVET